MAAEVLNGRPGQAVTAALLTLAQDDESGVRASAISALADRPGSAVTELLLALALDTDRSTSAWAWMHARAAEEALMDRVDPVITQWFLHLAGRLDDGLPNRSDRPVANDQDRWYQFAVRVAKNSHTWPPADRQRLIEAIGNYTELVTSAK
jgi:hypothetical protein